MGIRIDYIPHGSDTVVRIAGRLCGTAVAQLENACDSIEGSFMMDLSNLVFADDEGIKAIRAMVDKGARIQGASPFIMLLLEKGP